MIKLKVTTVGSSVGVVLTKEALARLKVKKGDTLFLTEASGGAFQITARDPEFARRVEMIEDIMREDRDILAALAK